MEHFHLQNIQAEFFRKTVWLNVFVTEVLPGVTAYIIHSLGECIIV